MRTVPIDKLKEFFSRRQDIVFAVIFGSGRDGVLNDGSDLDIGIYFAKPPAAEELLDLMAAISEAAGVDEIDLVDLFRADPILAFEAVSGRFLCKNDPDRTAAAVSLISREYEDVMWRLGHAA